MSDPGAAERRPERRPGPGRRSRRLYLGLTLLFLLFSAVYYLLQRGRGLEPAVLNNKVLLFTLWYVNVVLILTILFVLVRSLLRVALERRDSILGSKFKTKLVLSSIALPLIPVLILFPFATGLVIDSFDQWLELPIRDMVEEGQRLADDLVRQIEATGLRDAGRVLAAIEGADLEDPRQQPALQRRLRELREELELHYLLLYDGEEFVHAVADPERGISRIPELYHFSNFLQDALEKGSATKLYRKANVEGHLILVARAASLSGEGGRAVVLVGTQVPAEVAGRSELLASTHQSYLRLSTAVEQIRGAYLLMLLMVTLLVILASSSIGLRLARRVTEPIQALADATRRIRSGQLDHRVDVPVDDELGVLVNAFNRMAEDLERNKELVEKSRRSLEAARERLAAVLANLAAGVVAVDAEGSVLTCNAAALQILGQREEEVVGRRLEEAWSDPVRRRLAELVERRAAGGEELREELQLPLAGAWKTLEVKVKDLPPGEGQPAAGRVVVLEDLTRLIHAQKMATWNEVARRIAHEIKNPLTPIRLTAERLLNKRQQGTEGFDEALENGVGIIVREVSSLKSMVDEFSRFARMPQAQPREVDLEELLAETLRLYRGIKPGVEVEGEVDPEAATAWFDPEQLKGVLINLLDNALEATEGPGLVRVSTADGGESVHLIVADTGHGIAPEDRGKLFLPYFSTKGRGTGLGLAIVHRVLEEHNARIRVAENRPRGTVFTLEIPRV